MTERLYIAVPFHGRMQIADPCFSSLQQHAAVDDAVVAYADGCELSPYIHRKADRIVETAHLGIERQRRMHFMDFVETEESAGMEFTHLYLTDSDAIHSPLWRRTLLGLQQKYDGLPTCGYDTAAHRDIPGNIREEHDDALIQNYAPGISYLLTREHAEKVVRWLRQNETMHDWGWDWMVPAILGHQFVVSKPSVVEHIAHGGLHWNGGDGDRALNPTPWLAAKRAEIVASLNL